MWLMLKLVDAHWKMMVQLDSKTTGFRLFRLGKVK